MRHVELGRSEIEAVAVLAGLQPRGAGPETGAQPRDVGVQRLTGRVRHLGRPQRVHEVRDGDGAAFGEREEREDGPPLGPAAPRRRRRRPRGAAGRAAPPDVPI